MLTYLCGGINGLNDSECKDWRGVATEALGANNVLDPIARDYRGQEDSNVDAIVSGDLADIMRCDAVLVNATRPSWGTAMEIVYAYQRRKFIVAFVGEARVSPWLRFHCNVIASSIEESIATIQAWSSK